MPFSATNVWSSLRINRNIVECKSINHYFFIFAPIELIETLWNVNKAILEELKALADELIETLWNVNKSFISVIIYFLFELIETLWNVNRERFTKVNKRGMELIETLWNVNDYDFTTAKVCYKN